MPGQFGEKKFQILVGVENVGLGHLDDAVKHCAGFCAAVGLHDDKVCKRQAQFYMVKLCLP